MEDEVEDEVQPARLPVVRLRDAYYPVLPSKVLGKAPRQVRLWGEPYVIFRDGEGIARALSDSCPHRNVPLSIGRCLSDGTLECAYHGWRFSGDGVCREIPGRTLPLAKPFRASSFPCLEQAGYVWLAPSTREDLRPPFLHVLSDESLYTTVVREVKAGASVHSVAENALDVPHTSILHRGLFRGGARNLIQGITRRFARSVETEYIGEPPPTGLVARILATGGGDDALKVEHWDRFFLPGVVQVEYRLGAGTHFLITGYAVPIDDFETKLVAIASFRTPLPGFLLKMLLLPLGLKVFSQDRALLERQTENLRRNGARYISTEIDAMGPEIWRLLREAARREAEGLSPAPDGDGVPRKVREFSLFA